MMQQNNQPNLTSDNRLARFFHVYQDLYIWKSAAFLLLSLPLGIAYFAVLVTGIASGVALLVLLVGALILLGLFYVAGPVVQFEAWLARGFLGANVPHIGYMDSGDTLREQVGAALQNRHRWKGLLYLLLRFPLGIISFVMVMVLVSLPVALIIAPFTYNEEPLSLFFWTVDTFGESLIATVIGVLLGGLTLRVVGWVGHLWRRYAEQMLTDDSTPKRKSKPKRVPH